MAVLILGLIIFLGAHSARIVAEPWRLRTIGRIGELPWKGLYSLVSLAGFVLIVIGYGEARQLGLPLYDPPVFTRHIASLLMLPAMVLLVAAYVPRNHLKARFGHPMLLAVKLWALAHLLSNGRAAEVLLFGAFLAWAVADFIAARRRDRAAATVYPAGEGLRTVIVVVAGVLLWAVFAAVLHQSLIGVAPFAR
ncbi:MAG: NnrU family protein [Burkholderiales bacterium]|nr:NnrU family protein [Burkholderiales bacterium]